MNLYEVIRSFFEKTIEKLLYSADPLNINSNEIGIGYGYLEKIISERKTITWSEGIKWTG